MKKFIIASVLILAVTSTAVAGAPKYGTGRAIVTKTEMLYDPATGISTEREEIVCDNTIQIPIFNFDDGGVVIPRVDCTGVIDGKTILISTSAYIMYRNGSLYKNGPVEPLKIASTYTFFANDTDIPRPASQIVMTRELQQKNFILLSTPDQIGKCTKTDGCKFKYPVVFRVLWDLQDTN